MPFAHWYLAIGVLLLLLVLTGPRIERLPLSTAMVYLAVGLAFGWLKWLRLDVRDDAVLLERLSEIAVIVSLFSAGLKLRLPLTAPEWRLPVALAFGSMAVTVGLVAGLAMLLFDLPLGAAILLGAVLGPTDPVLASDVQVEHAADTDRVRFTLTGEAGLNDGTAFPFVMLGLGLLGRHDLGAGLSRWLTVDLVYATAGGLLTGAALGWLVGRVILQLRRTRKEAVGLDDFLAIGLIAVSYGTALLLHQYGFLAVFAAGLALRAVERETSPGDAPPQLPAIVGEAAEVASDPDRAPAYMAEAILQFNTHLERVGELALVLVAGAMLATLRIELAAVGFALCLLLVVRPLATVPASLVGGMSGIQAALIAWFGIRGIGSVYYLFYAIAHDLPAATGERLAAIALTAVALSVVAHGITVTPLMRWYEGHRSN